MMLGPFKPAPDESGFLIDTCHDDLKPGDVIIRNYRGNPDGHFTVLHDAGGGMWQFRDPDGVERPMRPSTMLRNNPRIERAS